ncbi:MAG: helix-turn-helix domain-containing protein [Spirochaetes bacterium]|nr:helix-turn-helix domain-containing protein [Spirochaetota bacterium]
MLLSPSLAYHDFDASAYLRNTGKEFRRVRLLRGLSRDELADLAGVHINTIGAVERGDYDLNSSTRCWILAALGTESLIMEPNLDRLEIAPVAADWQRADVQQLPESEIVRLTGATLRACRETHGLTLDDLAELSLIHRNSIWNIEQGLVSATSTCLHRLYRCLGVFRVRPRPPDWLELN